jgi:DNA polymerase-3 subunit alpha
MMTASAFVHLHNHTEYSLLDGAIRLKSLMERANKYQMPALAITDHGNMFGAIKFYKMAQSYGIKPILGCEVYVAPESRLEKSSPQGIAEASYHLILLATEMEGYKNLIKLVSIGYLEGFYYRPRIDKEVLAQYSRGLVALSSCLKGEIPLRLAQGQREKAVEAAATFKDIMGKDSFFLELQDQGLEGQDKINRALIELSKELDLPLVATNDCHYLDRTDAQAHDILLCIQTGKTLKDSDRLRFSSDQFYFRSPEEMSALFAEVPEALRNTMAIADRCQLELKFGEIHLPHYQPPPGYSLDSYLEEVAQKGLQKRLAARAIPQAQEKLYQERIKKELEIIKNMGYSGYFLIVWDFIDYARKNDIPVGPGRGSAAGSLVAYALGITDLDPIRYGLLFERFLNPERISLPDIDIDFCMERRDEVINYVIQKYGADNVTQIITFGTMLAKGVIRDVGRVINLPYAEVDKIAKLIPNRLNITLEEALDEEPRLEELRHRDSTLQLLLDTAQTLEGLPRHASIHAAGVVISPAPLVEYLPLYRGNKGEVTTQFAMDDIEELGLLKMDFLGLRTLTVIQNTLKLIKKNQGKEIIIEDIPLDDPATYQSFAEAKTVGIFQLESGGMRDLLKKLRPQNFEDIIALVALYRPGPLGSGMVEDFIRRRHGKVPISYDLPQLEPILRETYGVILYQEQVMQIASSLAGFSLGEADILRRAMGKKKTEVMAKQREKFLQGALAQSLPPEKAEKIFDLMEYFAGYGFNKSHSAAYALIAYRTAYLKTHFPLEFMAALMSSEMENSDRIIHYLEECREMGIKVLPPNINSSYQDFAVEDGNIRFALGAIKNVGTGAIEAIVKARTNKGKFSSFADFCQKVNTRNVSRRVLESLIKSGACDGLGEPRSRMMANLDRYLEAAQRRQKAKKTGQISLFASLPGEIIPEVEEEDIPEWDRKEILAYEKETLGFYLSGHPLDPYQELLSQYTNITSQNYHENKNGQIIRLGGMVSKIKTQTNKKGERWSIFSLEDRHGTVEVLLFPKYYNDNYRYLEGDEPVLVEGRLRNDSDKVSIIAERLIPLSQLSPVRKNCMHIRLELAGLSRGLLLQVKNLINNYPGDCALQLHLISPEEEIIIDTDPSNRVNPSQELINQIEELLGYNAVYLE